jgi:hypothetical protein
MDTVTRSKLLAKPEVQEVVETTVQLLRATLAGLSFAELEEAALAISGEATRVALKEELQTLADEFGGVVMVDGRQYKRHEPGTIVVHSLCGGLEVTRYTYREVGVRNGPTIVPMALQAGLVEGATPAFAYNLAHAYAEHDMRAHGEMLGNAHRVPPPRATLERLAKRLATAAHDAPPRIEAAVRRSEKLPEGASAISIGIDRTTVPMAEPLPEGAPPKPAPKRSKPRIRKAPEPIEVNYRMAYVATASVVDEDAETLVTRRYALPACDNPEAAVAAAMRDVEAWRKQDPKLPVGVIQDGAPEMWNLARVGLMTLVNKGALDEWHEGIDKFHLLDRLGSALELIEADPAERTRRFDEWNALLDATDSAIETIERDLVLAHEELPASKQERLFEHLVYIDNNKDRMRYASLASAGLPVGSGTTESAAKTVIGQRAKNSGQRWSEPGLRGVLKLRALEQSGRLAPFWSRLSRTYVANVVNLEVA